MKISILLTTILKLKEQFLRIVIIILLGITTLINAQTIGTGLGYHTIVGKANGTVYTWGRNNYGQLGNGNTGTNSNIPVAVSTAGALSGKTITAVTVGALHSMAVGSDGKVYTWGYNGYGQLGNGTNGAGTDSNVPVAVVDGVINFTNKTITAVAAGGYEDGSNHSIALDSDGKVYTWGYNGQGQLGNGNTGTNSNVPVAVSTLGALSGKTITAVAAGGWHSIALDSDGKVYTWGYNGNGQLGNGNTGTNSNVPVAISTYGALSGKRITAVAAGILHSIALDSEGKVYTWGYNGLGALGNGNLTDSNVPVAVIDGAISFTNKNITAIAAGNSFSIALASLDGTVYTWGRDDFGQLGNGDPNANSNVPVAVSTAGVLSGKTITAVAAGNYHSIALGSDGKVYTWGYNGLGALGSGNNTDSNVPVEVDQSEIGLLPVELTLFTATIENNIVILNWQTATEVSNYGFEIERSQAGDHQSEIIPNEVEGWEKIGFVQGHGNSNSLKEYSFVDKTLLSGKVRYRLKQVDIDGKYEYSKEIEVTVENATKYSLEQNFPNPFNPTTKIKYSTHGSEKVQIKVYDVLGREVKTLLNEYKNAGIYEIEFSGNGLTSGVYFYRITAGSYYEVKKMILLR